MRKILFRGKGDKKYNESDWYYGVPIQDSKYLQICTNISKRIVLPDTISEFIGKHDKNGKMIFEGDIVKGRLFYEDSARLYVVKYSNCNTSYYFVGADKRLYSTSNILDIEVLGNIWDNPELLRTEMSDEKKESNKYD